MPCARLSWPSRQLLSARKYTVSYRYCIQCDKLAMIIGLSWHTKHVPLRKSRKSVKSRVWYKVTERSIYF